MVYMYNQRKSDKTKKNRKNDMKTTSYQSKTGKKVTISAEGRHLTIEIEGLGIYTDAKLIGGIFDLGVITIARKPIRLKVPASAEAAEIFNEWKQADDENFARSSAEQKEYFDHYAKVTKAMAE